MMKPIMPPMTIAPMISTKLAMSCVMRVVATAMVMPAMPKRLPRRLDAGLESPRNARMKNTPAIRKASATQAVTDRKSDVKGKSVSVRVDAVGGRRIKKNKKKTNEEI